MGAHAANTNKKALIDIPKGIPEFGLDCVIVLRDQLRMGYLWLDICGPNAKSASNTVAVLVAGVKVSVSTHPPMNTSYVPLWHRSIPLPGSNYFIP